MAIVIHPDTRIEQAPDPLDLEPMKAIVGGWIEIVTLAFNSVGRVVLVVNEEGRILEPPLAPNELASRLAQQTIVGPAILATVIDGGEDTERWV